jgi:hypothetical protein
MRVDVRLPASVEVQTVERRSQRARLESRRRLGSSPTYHERKGR